MALLSIIEYPDPRLKTVARPVTRFDDRLRQLVADMAETMYEAPGVGLAATQVDVHERLVVLDVSETKDQLKVFINPEIVWASDELVECEEGCLSVPGVYDAVTRPARVRVRAQDERGESVRARVRRPAGGVRAARDGSPAWQGLRRIPVAAEAGPHQDEDAQAQGQGRCLTGRAASTAIRGAR